MRSSVKLREFLINVLFRFEHRSCRLWRGQGNELLLILLQKKLTLSSCLEWVKGFADERGMSQAGGQAEETQMALEFTRKSWNLFAPTMMKCFQFSSNGIFRYFLKSWISARICWVCHIRDVDEKCSQIHTTEVEQHIFFVLSPIYEITF